MTIKKIIFVIIYCCFSLSTILSQNNVEKGYPLIKNYSPKDYGADTQNWAILQDDRGIIYFGNNLGLLEFDGADWRLYSMPNNSVLRSIAQCESGEIYVGGQGDLGYFLSDSLGKLIYHSLFQFLPEEFTDFSDVWNTRITDNKVFFNTSNYTFVWDLKKETFKVIESENGFHGIFLVDKKIYFREWGKGLQIYENDSLVLVNGGDQFANERIYVMLPFPEEEGTILIVTRTMGMFKYDGKQFIPFKTEVDQFMKDNLIYVPGTILHDGNILLGTLNGGGVVIDRDGKIKHKYNIASGITSQNILFNFQDRAGAIWLASDAGISRIDYSSHVSYLDSRNDFSTTAVELIRHKGILYAATFEGIYYLDPLTSKFIKIKNNQAFTFYDDGDKLLAGSADGLYEINNLRTNPIRKTLGNEYFVNSIIRSKFDTSRYYIGAAGLWSMIKRNNGWKDEGQILDIEDIVNSVIEEKNGVLWLGTSVSGVFRVTPKKDSNGKFLLDEPLIENYNEASGLPNGSIYVKRLSGENYFLAAENFYRFDKNKQSFYLDNTHKVVPSIASYINPTNIREDNLRRLWVSLGREPALGTPQPDGTYQWLTAPFKRFSNELIQSIYPEDNGVVWITSNSTIIKYDLTKNNISISDYPALIRRVEIGADSAIYFGGKLSNSTNPEITYENNSVKFNFAAPSYEDETANQYKTLLQGFDKDWSPFEKANKKEYTNLSPGSYTFKVIAKNVFEIESQEATYSFEILSPWYRTWIAYFLYVFLLVGAVFLVDRYQRKRLLTKAKERMKIQQAEHRAETAELQAQAAEAQSKIVQAENDRKTQELEEARQLQLSMLPKELPNIKKLDIAVYMKTATEVGGDYYDFSIKEDGSLNICLGDATGHGMKAGTLVSMMKSLFIANSIDKNISEFFSSSNEALKKSKLEKMMMAFVMVNIIENKIEIANAGIPPVFIYRKVNEKIEEINVNGLPLGAMNNSKYKIYKSDLSEGDVILMLSDGLPELQNKENEQYGYERTISSFRAIANKSSGEIINHMKDEGSKWVNDNDPDDDVTFVVIKVK